ncbi:MAG: hypothetical protein ACK559_09250, partial [bacterium]
MLARLLADLVDQLLGVGRHALVLGGAEHVAREVEPGARGHRGELRLVIVLLREQRLRTLDVGVVLRGRLLAAHLAVAGHGADDGAALEHG